MANNIEKQNISWSHAKGSTTYWEPACPSVPSAPPWSPSLNGPIPPPPAVPPPQPQELDLTERLATLRADACDRPASSVAAQLFAMPAVVDHSKMLDDLGSLDSNVVFFGKPNRSNVFQFFTVDVAIQRKFSDEMTRMAPQSPSCSA